MSRTLLNLPPTIYFASFSSANAPEKKKFVGVAIIELDYTKLHCPSTRMASGLKVNYHVSPVVKEDGS